MYVLAFAGSAQDGRNATGGVLLLWRAALRLLLAVLRITEDRRRRGFSGAVLQVNFCMSRTLKTRQKQCRCTFQSLLLAAPLITEDRRRRGFSDPCCR